MIAIRYLDFDLSIESIARARTRYRARVLNSPAGQASIEFKLPFSKFEVENYILKIGRTRQSVRSLNSSEGRAAQEFGRRLYDAIFQDQVRDCLRRSLDVATQQSGQGLRIRLRLTAAQELADLPWEYLYDVPFKRFFAHSHTTPIVRYLDLSQGPHSLKVQLPLNVLVMIASPRDQASLDVESEWRKVQEALADLVQRGLVTLTRLEKATLAALQRQLRLNTYHIFHFIGHGGFDQQTQEGILLLEDERGLLRVVAGSYLGTLLHDHPTLQLAMLNACEGARVSQIDPFAGVAQTLVHQGIPAVIAMQFEITDYAAITLAQEFYTALADGYPVDAALAEARKAIYAEGNDVEWGTPVLYMRSLDGHIFDVTAIGKKQSPSTESSSEPQVELQVEQPPQTEPTSSSAIERVESRSEQHVVTSSTAQLAADEQTSMEAKDEAQSLPTLIRGDLPAELATEKPILPDKAEPTFLPAVAEQQAEQSAPSKQASEPTPDRGQRLTEQQAATPPGSSPPLIAIDEETKAKESFLGKYSTIKPEEVKQAQDLAEQPQGLQSRSSQPPSATVSVPTPISTITKETFFLQWLLANAVGWAVAVAVVGALPKVSGIWSGWYKAEEFLPSETVTYLAMAVAVVGAAQWLILRRYISQAHWWILASSVVGFGVGAVVGFEVGAGVGSWFGSWGGLGAGAIYVRLNIAKLSPAPK